MYIFLCTVYQLHIPIRNMSHLVSFSDQKLFTLLLPCLKSFIRNTLMHILFPYAIGPLIIIYSLVWHLLGIYDLGPLHLGVGAPVTDQRKNFTLFYLSKVWSSLG